MARKKKTKTLISPTITIQYGIHDCAKCEYHMRCEECSNSHMNIERTINTELQSIFVILDNMFSKQFDGEQFEKIRSILDEVYKEKIDGKK